MRIGVYSAIAVWLLAAFLAFARCAPMVLVFSPCPGTSSPHPSPPSDGGEGARRAGEEDRSPRIESPLPSPPHGPERRATARHVDGQQDRAEQELGAPTAVQEFYTHSFGLGKSLPVQGGAEAAARTNATAEAQALGLDGKPVDPFAATNAAATVLLFAGCDCPISNRYAPELRRLHEKFSPRGVRFWIVYPDADTTADEIRRHVREFNLAGDPLRDPRLWLVRKSRVKVTPEGAVFNAAGGLVYHGRIDDRVADFGKERPAPTQRDLHDAIEAVLAGKKPRNASTPAIGCRIPDPR